MGWVFLWEGASKCQTCSATDEVLVISYQIRYPDKAIRKKQTLQACRFSSPVLQPDELLKNEAQLKFVSFGGGGVKSVSCQNYCHLSSLDVKVC